MVSAQQIDAALAGTPFLVTPAVAAGMADAVNALETRVALLRQAGQLTEETLRRYYGDKRFEQVAESNAIEGSTLSVGETELAVTKGVTLTGHDPAFVRDAVALNAALVRLAELAHEQRVTDITQLQQLHELILDGSPSAGSFRSVPVRITGSEHSPPKTWKDVMAQMEHWERWSAENPTLPAIIRATALHAWLVHIHPYTDGNGRTARAIQNLELVRAGFPPAILRKKQDRDRYIEALHRADEGDLGPFLELVVERANAAVTGLESAAHEKQGYDRQVQVLREAQARRLNVWNKSVELLHSLVVERLAPVVEATGGRLRSRVFNDGLDLDDYIALCTGKAVSRSWSFTLEVSVPAVGAIERLGWVGFRSDELKRDLGSNESAPSLFWSAPAKGSYPPWRRAVSDAPGPSEATINPTHGDEWHVLENGQHRALTTAQLATAIVDGFMRLASTKIS